MDTPQHAFAKALAQAYRTGQPVDSADWQDSIGQAEAAYQVQDAVAAIMQWHRADAVPTYWKSGGPSRSAVFTHAALPPAGVRGEGADFSDLRFNEPGIESEIALRLARDVTPADAAGLADDAVDGLIDAMTVSVEIVDSRLAQGAQAPALLRLADNQSHGALALGEWTPYARRDWQAQVCETRINDQAPLRHTGTHALGDPAWLLPVWLRHVTRHGATVPAGTVVTTGTWVGVVPARAGDRVAVAFPGVGAVSLRI